MPSRNRMRVRPRSLPEMLLCFDIYTLQQTFGRIYAPLGFTYPQYLVMLVLWDADGLSVSDIGARVELDSGTLTPLIKRLEQAGRVVRQRDTRDERRVLVSLTDAGRALEAAAADIPDCVLAARGMSLEAVNDLRATLLQLRRSLNASVSSSPG